MDTLKTVIAAIAAVITTLSGLYLWAAPQDTTANWNDAQQVNAGLSSFTELYTTSGVRGETPWRPIDRLSMTTNGNVPNGEGYFPLMDSNNVSSASIVHGVKNHPESGTSLVIDTWSPVFRTEDHFDITAWVVESNSMTQTCRDFAQENYSSVSDFLSPDNPRAIMRTTDQGDTVEVFREVEIAPGEELSACRFYEINENLENFAGVHSAMVFNGYADDNSLANLQATYRYNSDWHQE